MSDDPSERDPGFREQVRLAFVRSPMRGLVIAFLLLLALGFLVAGVVEFWGAIVDALRGLAFG